MKRSIIADEREQQKRSMETRLETPGGDQLLLLLLLLPLPNQRPPLCRSRVKEGSKETPAGPERPN